MKTAVVELRSVAPYSQSRAYENEVAKKSKESHADYEERTWMNRLHVNEREFVVQPAMGYKNGLAATAKFLSQRITGGGRATFTKHFRSGILVLSDPVLDIKKDNVKGEWLFVPSDGVTGGGKRVWKRFPRIEEWRARVEFVVLDDIITEEAFVSHLKEFGKFIGIGRFRPERGGYYGRFQPAGEIEWQKDVE